MSCKYRLGVDTEPRLSVFPPKIDLDKSITITLIDIALTNEIRTVDVFVDAGQNKPINKALYYENDGLYRATYKVISDECLKEGKCNPSSIPVSSGNVMITYNSKTGKAYSEGFNVVMPQKEFVSSLLSKASPVQEIPEIMSLDELKNALDLLNNFESYFIVKGAKNISNIDLDISNSKEAGRFNTNLFGLSLFSFSEDAKRECDVICSRFDNSTSLFDNKINSFNDLKSNQLDMDDLCSCNCKGSVDVSINCREIVRRAYKKASIVN